MIKCNQQIFIIKNYFFKFFLIYFSKRFEKGNDYLRLFDFISSSYFDKILDEIADETEIAKFKWIAFLNTNI